MSYMDRALKAQDRRFARVLGKLGYLRSDMVAEAPAADPLDHDGDDKKGGSVLVEPTDELVELRAEYAAVIGKKAYHGWDADTLRAKIAEAKAVD